MTLTEEVLAPKRQKHCIPVLKTERLSLRAPRHSDPKAMTLLVNDRRIAAHTARIPHPYGIDDAKQFLAAANKRDGELCWVITLDDALIGMCGLDPSREDRELGYWLGVAYWGRGFATEAARAVIDYGFGDLE